MRTIGLGLGILLIALIAFVAFVALWPMSASRLLYPTIETLMLDDFVGITTDGEVRADLFAVEPTGIPTAPVAAAAGAGRVVERKQSRLQFVDTVAAFGAGEAAAEHQFV